MPSVWAFTIAEVSKASPGTALEIVQTKNSLKATTQGTERSSNSKS